MGLKAVFSIWMTRYTPAFRPGTPTPTKSWREGHQHVWRQRQKGFADAFRVNLQASGTAAACHTAYA